MLTKAFLHLVDQAEKIGDTCICTFVINATQKETFSRQQPKKSKVDGILKLGFDVDYLN